MADAIRVLGVSGSPRFGATHYAVNEALRRARCTHGAKTDYYSVRGKKIGFCTHCDVCVKKRQGCAVRDDMAELYEKLLWADAWILGSPVYQGTLSGQLKTVLDRCRALVAADPAAFRGKVGAGICVGGDRSGGQEPALQALTGFFVINEMIPVGGGAWGANLGASIWSQDKGEQGARDDQVGREAIDRVVDRLVAVVRLVRS